MWGSHLFWWNQESGGALCSQKILALDFALDFGMGGGGGWDLEKMRSVWVFRKDFPHLWALGNQRKKGWGPLMWPKLSYRGNGPKSYRISRVFLAHTPGAHGANRPIAPVWGLVQLPIHPPKVGQLVYVFGPGFQLEVKTGRCHMASLTANIASQCRP